LGTLNRTGEGKKKERKRKTLGYSALLNVKSRKNRSEMKVLVEGHTTRAEIQRPGKNDDWSLEPLQNISDAEGETLEAAGGREEGILLKIDI